MVLAEGYAVDASRRCAMMNAATLPNGERGPIVLRLSYQGPLIAPIAKGAQVAELEIRAGEAPPSHVPLFAAARVGKGGPLDRLVNGLVGLFT
jgi:D-alanyl-D-alanine carboxypeptidase (penicillin-binding protein 5/6)